jgi:NitT/TauT family transport system permease protein
VTGAGRGTQGPNGLVRALVALLGVALFFSAWWAAIDARHAEGMLAPFSLTNTAHALRDLLFGREIWPHVGASLRRILIGLGASVAIGIPLGAAVGALPLFAAASAPVIQFLRVVSPLAWTPLAIMLFGVGDSPVLFLIVVAAVWPIALATSAAVASLDKRLTVVGRSLGGSPFEIAHTIVWPSLRPQILTGIRVSIGVAWVILVPAEMLGVDSGLGYFILSTRDRLAYSELAAGILLIGLLGLLLDGAARLALSENRIARPRTCPSTPTSGSGSLSGRAISSTTPPSMPSSSIRKT